MVAPSTIQLSDGPISYEVVRSRRRTVAVSIREDGGIRVHAPNRATLREIHAVALDCRPWIERQRGRVLERLERLSRRRFVEGDTVPYRGRELTLRLREPQGARGPAVREGDRLIVPVEPGSAPPGREEVRRAVVAWLLAQAQDVVHARHRHFAPLVGTGAVRIVLKEMRSRWGSCGPSRRMSLNWRLILAPPDVLDYVLVHELCHVFEPNHSKAFWNRVAAVLPDYRSPRKWLRRHGDDLVV